VRALPNAVPIQRCQKVSQSIWRASPPMTSGFATCNSPSSKPPNTMTPTPCICCKPCPVSARCSASCCSTTSTRATASPGGRIVFPLAAWSNVPGNPPGNGRAHQAPQSAMLLSNGPFLKPPSCSSETIRQPSNPSPAWRKNMTKARHAPAWPKSERALSMTGSNARWLSRGRRSSNEKGGARMSLAPHWTIMGRTCKRRPRVLHALRQGTPRRL